MKKTAYLLIILFALVISLSANQRTWRLKQAEQLLSATGTQLQNSARHVLVYNPTQPQRVDSLITYSWAEQLLSWHLTEFQVNSWDTSGQNPLLTERFLQPGLPAWCKISRVYDNMGRLCHYYCDYLYDNEWECVFRQHYNYEGNHILSREDYHHEHFSNTRLYLSHVYTTDNAGRITMENRFCGEDSINWELDSSTAYAYHPNDVSNGEDYILKISSLDLLNHVCDLSVTGMVSEIIRSAMMDSLVLQERILCTYDASNRLSLVLKQNYADNWVDAAKSIYAYDINGNLQSIHRQNWDYELDDWSAPHEAYGFLWEEAATANDDDITPKPLYPMLMAGPNPCYHSLGIKPVGFAKTALTLEVYNLLGQKVKTIESTGGKELIWDCTDNRNKPIPQGIYFIRANQKGRTAVRKIVRL